MSERAMRVATEDILGFPVCCTPLHECMAEIERYLLQPDMIRPSYVVFVNPHSLECALKDDRLATAITGADLVLPDGIGVVWASRLLGGGIRGRITGSDIFFLVNAALARRGHGSVFFLGSSEDTLRRLTSRVRQSFPGITVAGQFAPSFVEELSGEDSDSIVSLINRTQPDVLWVSMTAPKQEKWIWENRQRLRVKLIVGVGAVFDFFAGTVNRPGLLMQGLGLEWLGRLVREPGRLWRRTLISAPMFMMRVAVARWGRSN